jgi:hypothetical protein
MQALQGPSAERPSKSPANLRASYGSASLHHRIAPRLWSERERDGAFRCLHRYGRPHSYPCRLPVRRSCADRSQGLGLVSRQTSRTPANVRFRGKSRHQDLTRSCPPMTHSGHVPGCVLSRKDTIFEAGPCMFARSCLRRFTKGCVFLVSILPVDRRL